MRLTATDDRTRWLEPARVAPPHRSAFSEFARRWARRRQGEDTDPVTLVGRRIYILPTGLGVAYAAMVFAMIIGAMNYANNLALGLAFLLGALGLVAMHHCHSNLLGLRVTSAGAGGVFAGSQARFRVALENGSLLPRHELVITDEIGDSSGTAVDPEGRSVLEVRANARQRGRLRLASFRLSSRYPFGLFRAWTYLHLPLECVVYPRPSERTDAPPPTETDVGSAQDSARGEEDFAGLRGFHAGDPPSRIAWKAYARGQGLLVKQYGGTSVTSHVFDYQTLEGLDRETRLSLLCRWILEAHADGHAYGLKLPDTQFAPNLGPAHRDNCLTALALFEPPDEPDA